MPIIPALPTDFTFPLPGLALVIIDMQRDFVEPGGFGETLGNNVGLLRPIIPAVKRRRSKPFANMGSPSSIRAKGTSRTCPIARPPSGCAASPTLASATSGPMGRILILGEPGNSIIPELCAIEGRSGHR